MVDAKKHALLSPSGAYRWMRCPGSIVLGKRYPGKDSVYAAEGTEAHDCAATFLETGKFPAKIDRDMARDLREYVTYVQSEVEGGELLVEQTLPLTWLTGEAGAEGTSDSVIISADGETLKVIDLKFGAGVQVYVHNNEQLMIYALAALKQFEMMGDFKKVKMVIHQPRLEHVDDWEVSVDTLWAFAEEVRRAVKEVHAAEASNSLDGFLRPSEKACRFCPAAGNCQALATMVVDETGCQFDNVDQKELIAPVSPHLALLKVDMIEAWCKKVRSAVEADLLAGKGSEFWKLVEGKKGARKWVNEAEVEKLMKKLKLTDDEMYCPRDLLTAPAAEKVLKKSKPGVWAELQKHYAQKSGPPSVAPISDPAPAFQPVSADDFEDVSNVAN